MNQHSNDSKTVIDLSDISDLLNKKTFDKHQLQIIEEVVFLCVNKDFNSDVHLLREKILRKFPRMPIPTNSPRQAERILAFIYEHLYKIYKSGIENLIAKYKLLPDLYWNDRFLNLDAEIKKELEDAESDEEKISKGEARDRAVEKITEDMDLDLFDSVILRNKPFHARDGYPFWCNPWFTRKTAQIGQGLVVQVKKERLTLLQIGFPPYATIPEMQKMLKENKEKIQKCQQEALHLPSRRDHRKDGLSKMIDAYILTEKGADKAVIANELEKKYKRDDLTFDAVSASVKRLKREAERFSKQETE